MLDNETLGFYLYMEQLEQEQKELREVEPLEDTDHDTGD